MYNTNPQVQIHSHTDYCAKVHVCMCVCVLVCVCVWGGGVGVGGCVSLCVWVGGKTLTVHHIKITQYQKHTTTTTIWMLYIHGVLLGLYPSKNYFEKL